MADPSKQLDGFAREGRKVASIKLVWIWGSPNSYWTTSHKTLCVLAKELLEPRLCSGLFQAQREGKQGLGESAMRIIKPHGQHTLALGTQDGQGALSVSQIRRQRESLRVWRGPWYQVPKPPQWGLVMGQGGRNIPRTPNMYLERWQVQGSFRGWGVVGGRRHHSAE